MVASWVLQVPWGQVQEVPDPTLAGAPPAGETVVAAAAAVAVGIAGRVGSPCRYYRTHRTSVFHSVVDPAVVAAAVVVAAVRLLDLHPPANLPRLTTNYSN